MPNIKILTLFIGLCIHKSNAIPNLSPPDHTITMVGTSYCSHSPDFQCFGKGWPNCCNDKDTECPDKKPLCDMLRSTPRKTDTPKSESKSIQKSLDT